MAKEQGQVSQPEKEALHRSRRHRVLLVRSAIGIVALLFVPDVTRAIAIAAVSLVGSIVNVISLTRRP